MIENLTIGFLTMTVCLTIQCVVVGALLDALIFLKKKEMIRLTLFTTSSILVVFMLVMLAGNFVQIVLWAGLFIARNEFTEFSAAFYHSVVNFSTLGYGDVVMSEKSRLLGAMEAANGVLMFGLTTGFLYSVLSGILERYWDKKVGGNSESKGIGAH